MSDSTEDLTLDSNLALSIGAVSRAAGIPVNTLRTWERRYGFPAARRSDGNQRLYGPEVVIRLRLIARALEIGHRPAQVVPLSADHLRQLLGPMPLSEKPTVEAPPRDEWLEAARQFDGEFLDRSFAMEAARLGLDAFLKERVSPFLEAVGDAWASGELDVSHEHFVSERLRYFLVSHWRTLSDSSKGAPVICANLPGEQHTLGLHMAASAMSLAGFKVIFIGADTPLVSIDAAARQARAVAVLVSVSISADSARAERDLRALRRILPGDVELLVGGVGAPDGEGCGRRFEDLADLVEWSVSFHREG